MSQTTLQKRASRGTAVIDVRVGESAWRLKSCRRCGGDEHRDEEGWTCLQCGQERGDEVPAVLAS